MDCFVSSNYNINEIRIFVSFVISCRVHRIPQKYIWESFSGATWVSDMFYELFTLFAIALDDQQRVTQYVRQTPKHSNGCLSFVVPCPHEEVLIR